MIGIGPLITIPLVLAALHGPLSLTAWILGAIVALCDGLVWAELGAAFPRSGGLYAFFLALFGPRTGRFLAFLFVWQFTITTPFLLASGYIGFAQYATYIWPALRASATAQHLLAVGVGLVTMLLLARVIGRIAMISLALFAAAAITLGIVAVAAWVHFDPGTAFTFEPSSLAPWPFITGLGSGLTVTLYDYLGYNTITSIGEEILVPERTVPRSIIAAVAIVAGAYLVLQTGVLGALPWRQMLGSTFVASTIVERAWGGGVACAVTILILITAFASTFALLLAASRVPFAAARDGLFLAAFKRLHPRDAYPYVSLFAIGSAALICCFLPLDQIIAVIGVGIVVLGGIGAFAAVLRLRRSDLPAPYRMPFFPLPPLIALGAWIYVVFTAGVFADAFSVLALALGAIVYGYSRSRTAASAGIETS
jgi:amino acid transporter